MATKRRSAASTRSAKAHQARVERDVRGLLIRVNADGLRALRQLALDEDTTLQSLAIEALNDLLKSRSLKPDIKNPLRQDD
jgi:DNA-binding protein YbaB